MTDMRAAVLEQKGEISIREASRPSSGPGKAYGLDQIEEVYELFGHQRDGMLKVAIRP